MTQKSMGQILEETLSHYTPSTRAVDHRGDCRYLTKDGRMCAVGRCMLQPRKDYNVSVRKIPNLDQRLKPEYRGHSVDFWRDIQYLHDIDQHWTSGGPSEDGLLCAAAIARTFNIPLSEVPTLTHLS